MESLFEIVVWFFIGLAALGWISRKFGGRPRRTGRRSTRSRAERSWEYNLSPQVRDWLGVARQAWNLKDWEGARLAYQKCGYGNVRKVTGERAKAKELLIQEQALFAEQDPLWREVISNAEGIVRRAPGIKQTDLYEQLSYDRETVSYALYFGELLGRVRRVKKGRSYALYPADSAPVS
jgi:hypothetical protein